MSSGVTHCVLHPPFSVPTQVRGGAVGGAEGIGASPVGEGKSLSRPPQKGGLEEMVVIRGQEAMMTAFIEWLEECE